MGRPEKPIPDPVSPLGKLAVALRNGRRQAGFSYAVLSERTRTVSPGTLQRAASGAVLPRLEVATAFAGACGLDVAEVTRLWHAAYQRSLGGRVAGRTREPEPRPDLVENLRGLCAALEELRQANGAPSFRMMERRARAAGKELSRSTAFRISRGTAPSSTDCLEAFLVACQVPPRGRTVWFDAWLRAQRQAVRARQDAVGREELKQFEAVVADTSRGQVSQETAVRMLRKAGFDAMERYRRFDAPWTVECMQCGARFRIRLSDVVLMRATCPDCPKLTEHVREAWAELLTNPSGLLSRQLVRALRAATVLPARLQRDHLDVPVFVADPTTLRTLQSATWHPTLEDALRRHIRRPFYLDVLLVHDYDTMPAVRTGQRHRRLAKAAGLVDSPLESSPARGPLVTETRGAATEDSARTSTGQPGRWKPTSNSGA
ncbi:helix-turn-helix domain-containing protein [Streptomyces geysiriensis]|uniref:helix-turn-helix domain-containing protein n=1 Tax=Streptomyces geysiriensis TaxID=68207 RepID=UPI001C7CEE5E|nr:helix-turn-helix domain-containing protein [Streptomyces geysiriensis]MBX4174439.1 helix-turn-helix domain-containing protein [Streptomyces geysiriensis]